MKCLNILVFLFLNMSISAQNFTINRLQTDSLIVGMEHSLQLNGYTKNDDISLTFPRSIRAKKTSWNSYILIVSRPDSNQLIIVSKASIPIDTIYLSIYYGEMKNFISTKNYGLIQSGNYPLEIIQDIDTHLIKLNMPGKKSSVLGYHIEIFNPTETLLYEAVKGASFNHESIKKALNCLQRNGIVKIYRVHAKLPYDDGKRPQDFVLKVK